MATVGGLRPTDTNSPVTRQKKGRVATQRDTIQQTGLNPTAAPVDRYARPAQAVEDNRAGQLASALSSLAPALQNLSNAKYAQKEQDQMAKLRYYTELFRQDKETGAVSAAQVKKMFPELVPTVASRIAQATGAIESKQWVQNEIQHILENDDLRLNTEARNAALEDIRRRAMEQIGGNEFYGNGFLEQMDRSLNEFETTWMRETAAHHEAVQADAFSSEIMDALKAGDNLLDVDRKWKHSSSLNHLERNKLVIDTATAMAVASNDPSVLDKIPDRFLNAESKLELEKAKWKIESNMYTQFVRGKELESYERQNYLRASKADIYTRLANGELVSPSEFKDDDELFEFTVRANSMPIVNTTVSQRNLSRIRSQILQAGTSGDFVTAFDGDQTFLGQFRNDEDVDEDSLRDHIMDREDLNYEDKVKLLGDLPTLLEGVSYLRDPDVNNYFDMAVGDDLRSWIQSAIGTIDRVMGANLQGQVRTRFYEELRWEIDAHIEEHNALPNRREKMEMVRRVAAMSKAHLVELQEMLTKKQPEQRSRNRQEPTPATAEGSTITLPNGVTVQRIE